MTDMRQKKENNHHTIHSEVNNVDVRLLEWRADLEFSDAGLWLPNLELNFCYATTKKEIK